MISNSATEPLALTFPDEVLWSTAPHLPMKDCALMRIVCSQWGSLFGKALDEKLYNHVVFDEKKWLQVPGISDVSSREVNLKIKTDYIKKLKMPCDVFNEPDLVQAHKFQKTIGKNYFWQTHKVILLPLTINGEPVTINKIGELFSFEKTEKQEKGTVFDYIYGAETEKYRNLPLMENIFIEVTLDVVPGSRRVVYAVKEGLVKSKGCRVPTPLEALISNVVLNIEPSQKKEGYYFGKGKAGEWWTYTITDTKINECVLLVVGGASPLGPAVQYCNDDAVSIGVMAVAEVLRSPKDSSPFSL